ncbi:MAG TPA: amino acid permease [Streptosporangiaceae bacterium]|nr:amino acid permease [Streptosporangiaceae bacterium]
MAADKEIQLPDSQGYVAESLGYAIKRRLLGPPLVTEQLESERLSRPLALGVLSCDGISSAAYGTEEILIELVQFFGFAAAFALLIPMTGVVLFGIAIVVLLYREVVSVYTRAGGSYVVARDNFGPRIAQVAAVALLIDYVVTVAVQTAAGSAAIVSAIPNLTDTEQKELLTVISVVAILLMCYGNLRGIREAGKTFALPTYLFSGTVGIMIIVGIAREIFTGLPTAKPGIHAYCVHSACHTHPQSSLFAYAAIFVVLRAFANGGSSLTGIEAVSNAVSALKPPEGRNARQVLLIQGSVVAFLIAGISWLAHVMHTVPSVTGVPTVLAQEAKLIFGHGAFGSIGFIAVQVGTAAILFTGGNTSFSGFPFLASFVAEDSFLPRQLTKRGHRLVFSSGIIVLTVISLALLLIVGANVNNLIPFYAIGVFTGFSMAGLGMAKFHRTRRAPGWQKHFVISIVGAVYTGLVVLIFAIVKFTEGAWLVVIVFPVMVFLLIRVNREYRMEAHVLEDISSKSSPPTPPTYSRRTVYVFVDEFDLATLAALRYARSLRPTSLRAVHFVLDNVEAAKLREDWLRANTGVVLDLVDCPDRRLAKAAAEMVRAETLLAGVGVTAVLPRRSYSPWLGRLLHDRTADQIASVVSQIPHAAATIVPFDVRTRVESMIAKEREHQNARPVAALVSQQAEAEPTEAKSAVRADAPMPPELGTASMTGQGDTARYNRPSPSAAATPIGSLPKRGRATVEGRVHAVEIRPVERNTVLACEIVDSTGQLTAMFYGRSYIPGLDPGAKVRLTGPIGSRGRETVMINPAYELLAPGSGDPPAS